MNKNEREELLSVKFREMLDYEREIAGEGVKLIAGVDEVGRGPLAGPVIAAAVVLPDDFAVLGINDSKKLSGKKREELYELIKSLALACGIGSVDNKVIDEINILEATKLAMREAISIAAAELRRKYGAAASIDHVLIDALTLPGLTIPQTGIIKGDEKSLHIAAASIIAKVTRDRLMLEFHKIYPAYSFDQNKGYGTKLHYLGIEKAGLCPIHRLSFCKQKTR